MVADSCNRGCHTSSPGKDGGEGLLSRAPRRQVSSTMVTNSAVIGAEVCMRVLEREGVENMLGVKAGGRGRSRGQGGRGGEGGGYCSRMNDP
jgi:hypothetical protein